MAELRSESHWRRALRAFMRHRLALVGGGILLVFYLMAAFAGFFSVYDPNFYTLSPSYRYAPPTRIYFRDPETGRLTRPFVYRVKRELDLETFTDRYVEDRSKRYPIYFFVRTPSQPYTVFKLFKGDLRLLGLGEKATEEGARLYLIGADAFGRDLYSRIVYGGQVSLTIGIFSVFLATLLGLLLGGLAGYFQGTRVPLSRPLFSGWSGGFGPFRLFGLVLSLGFWLGLSYLFVQGLRVLFVDQAPSFGGVLLGLFFAAGLVFSLAAALFLEVRVDPDDVVMRLIEIIAAIPGLFLLVTLRSAFPVSMDPLKTFYMVVAILAFIGWGGLARTVRGMVLSIREMDYVTAAKALGVSELAIITKHVLPATASYVIVAVTLGIPGFILAESGLSFLGLGITEPYTSWGLLLQAAQDGGFASFADRPWVLVPGFMIFLAVLAWNFVGDGLRDALDPRRRR